MTEEPAAEDGAESHGWVEVTAGDPTDCVGHDHDGETEGEPGRRVVVAGHQCRAHAEEDQHEGAEQFGPELLARRGRVVGADAWVCHVRQPFLGKSSAHPPWITGTLARGSRGCEARDKRRQVS